MMDGRLWIFQHFELNSSARKRFGVKIEEQGIQWYGMEWNGMGMST